MADSLIAAAQFACFEAQTARPSQVDVLGALPRHLSAVFSSHRHTQNTHGTVQGTAWIFNVLPLGSDCIMSRTKVKAFPSANKEFDSVGTSNLQYHLLPTTDS
jgi:hypothetical protein